MSDVDIEEFGASADMAAAIVDPAIAPEPEFDVGREQVSLLQTSRTASQNSCRGSSGRREKSSKGAASAPANCRSFSK